MKNKQHYYSGSPWEKKVAYSRAVRVGNTVEVAGTTAVDKDGDVIAKGDAYGQTKAIFEIIEKALEEVGATIKDVVRTRMYVTDISQWEAVGKAHKEAFEGIDPVATMVEVSRLIDPDLLVEVEVTAIMNE